MVLHSCYKCNYKTTQKSSLINHLNRKNSCDKVKIDCTLKVQKNENITKTIVKKNIIIDVPKKVQNRTLKVQNKEHICTHCDTTFVQKSSLTRHLNNNICNQNNQIKQQLNLIIDENKAIKEELKKLKETPPTIINNTTNNNTNNTINYINILNYMSPENVIKTFKEYFKIEDLSEINLADFTHNNFLKNEDMPTYLNKDSSRLKTCYLDEKGKEIPDVNQQLLINLIKPGFEEINYKYKKQLKYLQNELIKSDNKNQQKMLENEIKNIEKEYSNVINIPKKGKKFRKRLVILLPKTYEEKIAFLKEFKANTYYYNIKKEIITKRINQKITQEDIDNFDDDFIEEEIEMNENDFVNYPEGINNEEESNEESDEEESNEESNEEEIKEIYSIKDNIFLKQILAKYGGKVKATLIKYRKLYLKNNIIYLHHTFTINDELKHNSVLFISNMKKGLGKFEQIYQKF
jgi:hypothetical protein